MAAIVDSLFNVIGLDANDMIGMFIVLDLLTAAAWIWGTNYRIMRGIATVCAVAVTALAALYWSGTGSRETLKARSSLIAAGPPAFERGLVRLDPLRIAAGVLQERLGEGGLHAR